MEWQGLVLGAVILIVGVLMVPVIPDEPKGAPYAMIVIGPMMFIYAIVKSVQNYRDHR